ncbi:MAG: DUF1924 domain-containing protein [Mizugakiibacter sp.]|uniref:DUF1924 domain-containing protein n=1 Tax=Mizugakiibacter sp. TaxID=1972610 RepID=UPI0031C0A5FF|nr:DUF1924 domain-containing protein [Xanthomonadaceae bacterium]
MASAPLLVLLVLLLSFPLTLAQANAGEATARGRQFFNATHGNDWSCASCHTRDPRQPGRHAVTGRELAPLAPAANPERFKDPAKAEKWFRRNCRDVVGRECTAAEKADITAWLSSLPAEGRP